MKFLRREFVCIIGVILFMTGLEEKGEGAVTLTSSLNVSEKYDDNLFFTENNREADYTTLVGPAFNLAYESRDVTFNGGYQGTMELHARHPEANQYAQAATIGLGLPFLSREIRGIDVRVTEDVSYSPEVPAYSFSRVPVAPGEEQSIIEIQSESGGIQIPRADTFINKAGLELGYTWLPRLRTTVFYSNIVARYSGNELHDYTTHRVGIDETYQWSPRTLWTNSYSVALNIIEGANNEIVHRITSDASYQVDKFLSINGNIGVNVVSGADENKTGLILGAGLKKQFKNGNLSLRYSRDIETGGGLTTTSNLNQGVGGTYIHYVGRDTSVYVGAAYTNERSFSGDTLRTFSYTGETGINMNFLLWLSGFLKYSYLNQKSYGTAGDTGHRNLAMLGVTASAPPWKMVK